MRLPGRRSRWIQIAVLVDREGRATWQNGLQSRHQPVVVLALHHFPTVIGNDDLDAAVELAI